MAELSGTQFQQIQASLEASFSRDDLAQLVRVCLDRDLEAIGGNGTLSAVVFDLIRWAERNSQVAALAQCAAEARPHNPKLASLAAQLAGQEAQAPGKSTPKGKRSKPAKGGQTTTITVHGPNPTVFHNVGLGDNSIFVAHNNYTGYPPAAESNRAVGDTEPSAPPDPS